MLADDRGDGKADFLIQLERAQAKIARRDETIISLRNSQVKVPRSDTVDLESKLQELVKRYEDTKTKVSKVESTFSPPILIDTSVQARG
jgi:hypothetical protein